MKLGKIFICINLLILSLLMLTGCRATNWTPKIVCQPTDNRTIEIEKGYVLNDGHSYDIIFHFVEEQP